MEKFIAIFGGLIFACLNICVVFIRIVIKKKLQLLDWFLLSLGLFNGIGFGFVLWATHVGRNYAKFNYWLLQYDVQMIFIYLLSNIVLGSSVYIGWHLSIANSSKKSLKLKMNIEYKEIVSIAWISFFIGFVCYWLYARAYGGFSGALLYSRAVRAGISSVDNPYSFLRPFGNLSYFASYTFFGAIIDRNKMDIKTTKKSLLLIGFCFSFVFSIYVLYEKLGRFSFITFFATFGLAYVILNYDVIGKFVIRCVIFFVSVFCLLLVSDSLLRGSSSRLNLIELLAKELAFPFVGYINQILKGNYRWFSDIIFTPLFILPQRFWGRILNIETASSYNTFIIEGSRKGQGGVTGELPVDLLTLGQMQASIFGVLFVGLIFGYILWRVELKVNQIPFIGVRAVIYSNVIINIAARTVLYGDPEHIVVRNFELIIGFILISLFRRISLKSKKAPFT